MDTSTDIGKALYKTTNSLLLNAISLPVIGLNGKSGIAVFLYNLFEKTHNEAYLMMADKLVDHIYRDINKVKISDFISGLSGIGWCLDYLINNKFLEANSDDILEELDEKLLQLNRQQTYFEYDFMGLYWPGIYLSIRKNNKSFVDKILPIISRDIEDIFRLKKQNISSGFLTSFIYTINLLKNDLNSLNKLDSKISDSIHNIQMQTNSLIMVKCLNDSTIFPLINEAISEKTVNDDSTMNTISSSVVLNLIWPDYGMEDYIKSLRFHEFETDKTQPDNILNFGLSGLSSYGMALLYLL